MQNTKRKQIGGTFRTTDEMSPRRENYTRGSIVWDLLLRFIIEVGLFV